MKKRFNFSEINPIVVSQFFISEKQLKMNDKKYFYLDKEIVKAMDSSEKFAYAYAHSLKMLEFSDSSNYTTLALEFEAIESKKVAERMLQGETGFFGLVDDFYKEYISDFGDFANVLLENGEFFKQITL